MAQLKAILVCTPKGDGEKTPQAGYVIRLQQGLHQEDHNIFQLNLSLTCTPHNVFLIGY